MANANSPEPEDVVEAQQPVAKSARQRAEELMDSLNHDKVINELFADAFERQYLIYGKPPKEWRKEFRVAIPESPDAANCKAIASRIAMLTQDATFFYAAAEAQLDALASGQDKEYNMAFAKLVAEYKEKGKSLPAAKTLESMAQMNIMDINGAIQNAKIIKNFWKRILEGLTEVRKDLEIASWNNSTIAKQEQYGGGGSTPNRGEFGRAELAQSDDKQVDWGD